MIEANDMGADAAETFGGAARSGPGIPQSGLRALASVARHMGLDWTLQRLMHVHGRNEEPDAEHLAIIARAEGLTAHAQRVGSRRLMRFARLAPFLVRMESGAWLVAVQVGIKGKAADGTETEGVALFDPLAPEVNLFPRSRAPLTARWT